MTNQRNFIAGVASSGWTALIGLLAMPWYLAFLGLEAFGMIGIHLAIQSLFAMLDMGFSPAVSREIARSRAAGMMEQGRTLVHSMALIFVIFGILAALALSATAPWLAENWLNSDEPSTGEIAGALALSAISIGARWPGTLYSGALTGAQRIDLSSGVTIASTTLANGGAIVIMAFVEPSLRAFFIWQILVGLFHSLAMRWMAWRVLGPRATAGFNWPAVKSIWRFTAGMAAVTATGVVIAQADRVVLANTSNLAQVGQYTIAVTLAGLLYRLAVPAFNVTYPRLTGLFETGSAVDVLDLYQHYTQFFLTLVFPVALFIIVCARPILSLWLADPQLAASVNLVVVLLTLGTALHCIMYFPFALQIASGNTNVPIVLNIILAGMFIPALYILSNWRQALGAALAWLALHMVYFALGTFATSRYVLRGAGWSWVLKAVLPPLTVSAIVGFAAFLVLSALRSDIGQLLVGAVFAAVALVVGLALVPEARVKVRRLMVGMKRGH